MSDRDHGTAQRILPPRGLAATLKQLGPGMILSASIVGSGELIATTTLGSRVGLAALWLILMSCVIKVVVQEELGRYTIMSGETTFRALDRVPGPRWRVSWVVWAWMLMYVGITFQLGGIIGGTAQIFSLIQPGISIAAWSVIIAVVTMVLLAWGRYRFIERAATFMVVTFTLVTTLGAAMIWWTPYAPKLSDIAAGLSFRLPDGGLAVAFAVFGITGVGASELIYYPYWCLEKGYARYAGRNDGSDAWVTGARGWIGVMQVDALVAMVVYTVATVAFYLLGASVLHGQGLVPAGNEMVQALSKIYTSTLGPWAFYLFLAGAFFVLYSTIFSATASNARVVLDFLQMIQAVREGGEEHRRFWLRVMVVLLVSLNTTWYLIGGEPVAMVLVGGIAQACMLPIIGFSTLYLRYRHFDPALRPRRWVDALLWLCSTLMLSFAIYTLVSRLLA